MPYKDVFELNLICLHIINVVKFILNTEGLDLQKYVKNYSESNFEKQF